MIKLPGDGVTVVTGDEVAVEGVSVVCSEPPPPLPQTPHDFLHETSMYPVWASSLQNP